MSSVSNGLYFLTLPLVSVMRAIEKYVMRVIYTSKGMSKSLGCALYIRCALSIEKYGNYFFKTFTIFVYSSTKCRVFANVNLLGS